MLVVVAEAAGDLADGAFLAELGLAGALIDSCCVSGFAGVCLTAAACSSSAFPAPRDALRD
jgi:hypothetical protein